MWWTRPIEPVKRPRRGRPDGPAGVRRPDRRRDRRGYSGDMPHTTQRIRKPRSTGSPAIATAPGDA